MTFCEGQFWVVGRTYLFGQLESGNAVRAKVFGRQQVKAAVVVGRKPMQDDGLLPTEGSPMGVAGRSAPPGDTACGLLPS